MNYIFAYFLFASILESNQVNRLEYAFIFLVIAIILAVVIIGGIIWYYTKETAPPMKSSLKEITPSSQDESVNKAIKLVCPKCQTLMEEGYIPEKSYPEGTILNKWVKGRPEWSTWLLGIKVSKQESLPIMTYRCPSCGYLESYAR